MSIATNKKNSDLSNTPILFPYNPEEFWEILRQLIREEIKNLVKNKSQKITHEISGLEYKPLYKMNEVCALFNITRPTIYDWIKHGKLKPHKIRSRVYFLWNDLQQLWSVMK